ncbi:unnamed protein product [Peronospora belbahrii]|uniref:Copper transport protein n=1 Tax=Peronospora belbahrii TaxID=622444 RepID=A0AAU9LJZ0_9STRA|nr:unnamed protein product [Peronospora belbahrii]CAH0521661.1 unnamed protein product [Peronospora belbahrii]
MKQSDFCIGPGSVMGTTGLKWAGRNPMDDCSMLWMKAWGLTSFSRVLLACFVVFFLAMLSQYLTTSNGFQLHQSKVFAKRRLMRMMRQVQSHSNGSTFYDPGLGDECGKSKCSMNAEAAEESAVHPELHTKTTTISTVERVTSQLNPMSVKVGNWTHLADAMMRGVRIFLAYVLMLVVMTYNLMLITSIVVGFMTGFFVFSKDTAKVPVSADPCCS